MASWSFRRRIKIIPGVRLNFSKSGISTSIGIRGLNLTLGKGGTYLNTGIPGTGIYKREKISSGELNQEPIPTPTPTLAVNQAHNIFSIEPEHITSQDMQGVKEAILDAHKQRDELTADIAKVKGQLIFSKLKIAGSYLLVFGFFIKNIPASIKEDILKQKEAIMELGKQRDESYVKLDIEFDDEIKVKYERMVATFKGLSTSQKIWDITREEHQDRVATRSYASRAITRKTTSLGFGDLEDIKFDRQAMYFKNVNGADLYFYPNFVVMKSKKDFGVIGLNELQFNHSSVNFVEDDKVPSDSKIVDYTWLKVNKNGTPDKRFKANRQIPIAQYGVITLTTSTGVNEEYQFSNYEACDRFGQSFEEFKRVIQK